jgi:hypothetical protein
MPSYQVTFAIDDKDVTDMQTVLAAMPQSEFEGVIAFQNAIKNSGLGSWLKAQLEIAGALRP